MPEAVPYIVRPFVADRYEPRGRLGDYMRADGRDVADALRYQGAMRAKMLSEIGQGVSGTLQDIAQYPEVIRQRQMAALKLQEEQDAAARARWQFAQQQKAAAQQEADQDKLNGLLQEYGGRPPADRIVREFGPLRGAQIDKGLDEIFGSPKDAAKRGADIVKDMGGYGPLSENAVDDVMQSPDAGRVRYSFGPGMANGPEVLPNRVQQEQIDLKKKVEGMGGLMESNGTIKFPPKPDRPAPPGSIEQQIADALAKGDTATVKRLTEAANLAAGARRAPEKTPMSLNLPGAYGTAFSRAILSAPPLKRAGLIQTANNIAASGSEDDLKSLIRQAAIEGENVDIKNQTIGRMSTIKALEDAKGLIQAMAKAGIPTNILSGTAEDVMRKLGKTNNPAYVKMAQNLQDVLINYRRAATGAQFGEAEGKQYEKMFPKYTNDLPVNVALIDGLLDAMKGRDRFYWEYKLGPEGAALVGAAGAPKQNPFRRRGGE